MDKPEAVGGVAAMLAARPEDGRAVEHGGSPAENWAGPCRDKPAVAGCHHQRVQPPSALVAIYTEAAG